MSRKSKTSAASVWALVLGLALAAAAAWIAKSVDYDRPAIRDQERTNWDDLYYGEGRHAPKDIRDGGPDRDAGAPGPDGGA